MEVGATMSLAWPSPSQSGEQRANLGLDERAEGLLRYLKVYKETRLIVGM